jgi:hypothetical protein
MTLRDELLRAAVHANATADQIVQVHRLAPLVEHAVRLQQAGDAAAVVDAVVAERTTDLTADLTEQLLLARRRATRAEAKLAALGAAA